MNEEQKIVLVYDDAPDFRGALGGLLTQRGFEVIFAKDDAEARRVIGEQRTINAAFVDQGCLDRGQYLDMGVVDLLRETYPGIFIAIDSGDPIREQEKMKRAGVRFFITKGCWDANVYSEFARRGDITVPEGKEDLIVRI